MRRALVRSRLLKSAPRHAAYSVAALVCFLAGRRRRDWTRGPLLAAAGFLAVVEAGTCLFFAFLGVTLLAACRRELRARSHPWPAPPLTEDPEALIELATQTAVDFHRNRLPDIDPKANTIVAGIKLLRSVPRMVEYGARTYRDNEYLVQVLVGALRVDAAEAEEARNAVGGVAAASLDDRESAERIVGDIFRIWRSGGRELALAEAARNTHP